MRPKTYENYNKYRTSQRKEYLKRVLFFLGAMVTLLTLIQLFTFLYDRFTMGDTNKVSVKISHESKNIETLNEIEYNRKIHEENLAKYQGELVYAIIQNNTDNTMPIDKFTIHATNIKVDFSAELVASYTVDTTQPYNEGSLHLSVTNTGWGEAKNIDIKVEDELGVLEAIYPQEKLISQLETIKAGERIENVMILDAKYLKQHNAVDFFKNYNIPEEKLNVLVKFNFDSKDISNRDNENTLYPVPMIDIINGGFYSGGIGGGRGPDIYGILINTEKAKYQDQFNIKQEVAAHDYAEIPVFMFTDKTCSLKYYFEFEIGGKTFKSNVLGKNFKVNSAIWERGVFDGHTISSHVSYGTDESEYNEYAPIKYFPYNLAVDALKSQNITYK